MSTATGNSASHNYAAGEVYIFKGCDTWNFATIGRWTPGASGTSGNLIQWGGFDQTWYNTSACAGGWNRPIFSGAGTYPGANGNWFMDLDEDNYWRVAWIEWTGLYVVNAANNTSTGFLSGGVGDAGFEIDHNYMHGITFTFTVSCTVSGATYPCTEPFMINQSSTAVTGEIDHNVFSGADTTGTCSGCYATARNLGLAITGSYYHSRIDHNWMEYLDCWVGTFYIVDDNTMNGCGPFSAAANSVHNNVFENNADPSSGSLMYNNLIENSGTLGYATVSQLAPPSGVTSYYFNNVTTNYLGGQTGGQTLFSCSTPSGGGGGLCTAFNNTAECGPDTGPNSPPSLQCFVAGAAPLTFNSSYNQFITSNGSGPIQCYNSLCGAIAQIPSANLTQTLSAANGQGYTLANNFAPQNGSGSTIQAGATPSALVTLCNAVAAVDALGAGAGTACESSTTCGVSLIRSPYYNVGSSNCAAVARLTNGSTNNDAGAYQFSGAAGNPPPPPPTGNAPQPPTGLTATVH